MPILPQPIDNPDAMAERILDLERQKAQTKRSSLSGPIDPSPALLNPYSLELVGTGAGNTGTPPPFLPHALGGVGSPHTGTLLDTQGPQFAMVDGSRQYGGHLIPADADAYALGEALKPWSSLYATNVHIGTIYAGETYISDNLHVEGYLDLDGDQIVLNSDGTDVDVELQLYRNTGGAFSLFWNGVMAWTTKPFRPSELIINRISDTAPATTYPGMVWVHPNG